MKLETVSHSSLSTYGGAKYGCPAKFNFSYVRKIWPEKISEAFAIGGAIHKVLAEMYRKKIKNETLVIDEASKIFLNALKQKPIELRKGITEKSLVVEYQGVLNKILASPLDIEPAHIEMFYEVDFINPLTKEKLEPKLRGIIDLVSKSDAIVEHKTSSKKYTPETILESYQHIGYFVGFCGVFKRRPTKIIYDVIYKMQNPAIDIFEVKISNTDVKAYFDWVKGILKQIEADNWTPKPEYLKCKFCPYNQICLDSKF